VGGIGRWSLAEIVSVKRAEEQTSLDKVATLGRYHREPDAWEIITLRGVERVRQEKRIYRARKLAAARESC
jgi:hypothetical protein